MVILEPLSFSWGNVSNFRAGTIFLQWDGLYSVRSPDTDFTKGLIPVSGSNLRPLSQINGSFFMGSAVIDFIKGLSLSFD